MGPTIHGHDLHDDPRMPGAWGPWFSHEYINYHAVMGVPGAMDLSPVAVRPGPGPAPGDWPEGPGHRDAYKEAWRDLRRLDPLASFDYGERNGEYASEPPVGRTIEPWKVFVIYSTEPDLHLDCGLSLHRLQRLTGGSHGWRHLSFDILGLKVGIASESFRIHRDLAKQAFDLGNGYWGWRYLSRCSHYLADLGNPFHVKAAPFGLMAKNALPYANLLKTISAFHQGYEVYVERRFRQGFPLFREAVSRGAAQGCGAGGPEKALEAYMRNARKRLNPLFEFFMDEYGRDLIDAFSPMDDNTHLDVSVSTTLCSREAAEVIFREKSAGSLGLVDEITREILFDVGRMLGSLLGSSLRLAGKA
jgi:hypothetical protein